jgi:hypothetical protein
VATKKTMKAKPKQVVYLLGAGATQAEVSYLGAAPVNLLMRDSELGQGLSTGILDRLGAKGIPFLATDLGVDIEKLISLLAASGVDSQLSLAERMRKLYFQEICSRLTKSKIIRRPALGIGLLEMHSNVKFRAEVESLEAILTTNHDGLLQLASQKVFGAVDIGFPFTSDDLTPNGSTPVPPILQLHGSFGWKFGVPLRATTLKRGYKYSPNTMWIPPTVLKESKNYPFNKIHGLAYEILAKRCDVLRVIGASLTQNDWNVLCLIFNAQRHRELVRGAPFLIEFIMSRPSGEEIQANCSYLKNMFPINHLSQGDFTGYDEDVLPADSELRNSFAYWLREKVTYHLRRDEFDLPISSSMAQIAGDTV